MQIKSHNGFFSCLHYEIEGDYKSNRLCFPYGEPLKRPKMRTHIRYVERAHNKHYMTNSSIIEIPQFDVVNNFSLDYLHMICLGVTKKILLLWIKTGPLSVRLPSWKIIKLSNLSSNLKSNFQENLGNWKN